MVSSPKSNERLTYGKLRGYDTSEDIGPVGEDGGRWRSNGSFRGNRYAAEIARCFRASLRVVYVYKPVPLGEYVCEPASTILEQERDRLCKLVGELPKSVKPSGLMCQGILLVGRSRRNR